MPLSNKCLSRYLLPAALKLRNKTPRPLWHNKMFKSSRKMFRSVPQTRTTPERQQNVAPMQVTSPLNLQTQTAIPRRMNLSPRPHLQPKPPGTYLQHRQRDSLLHAPRHCSKKEKKNFVHLIGILHVRGRQLAAKHRPWRATTSQTARTLGCCRFHARLREKAVSKAEWQITPGRHVSAENWREKQKSCSQVHMCAECESSSLQQHEGREQLKMLASLAMRARDKGTSRRCG